MTEPQATLTQPRTSPPATPIWNDVNAPDAAAARAFYTNLFGWDVAVTTDPRYGGYGMFSYNGKLVAGVGPTMDEHQPAAWTTYVRTENAEETAAKVAAAGGQVVVPPMVVGPNGTMAIFTDPASALFGVWQPGTHTGAELFHKPVSVAWNELHSRDIGASSDFYEAVFGWKAERSPFGDIEYTHWKIEGRPVAGGVPLDPTRPAGVPSHWFSFFSVPNCDEMVVRARDLDATVIAEPVTSEDGRYAILQDPQGAVFGVISAVAPQ